MKKLNESQMIIFEEETARAIMLKKAKESLNETEYHGLLLRLPQYESKADLEGISRIELYEGIFGNLYDTAVNATKRIANFTQTDRQKFKRYFEEFDDLAEQEQQLLSVGTSNPEIFAANFRKLAPIRSRMRKLMNDITKQDPEEAQIIKKTHELTLRKLQREMDAEGLKNAADILGLKPEDLFRIDLTLAGSPGAKKNPEGAGGEGGEGGDFSNSERESDLQSVFNRFRQKVDLDGDGKVSDDEKKKADKDGDGDMDAKDIIALLISLGVKDRDILIQIINKLGLDPEGGDPEGKSPEDEAEDKAKEMMGKTKTNRVAKLQDQVILALNKVLDAKNIDMSRKDTMELAKTLTNNIVDQLRANGVKFKGLDESIYKAISGKLLLEEEEPEEGKKEEKEIPSKLDRLIKLRVKRLSRNNANFIKMLTKIRKEFADKDYGKKDVFKGYINTDVEQEFVGLYDSYIDIMALGEFEKILKKKVKDGDKSAEQVLKRAKNAILTVAGKKVKGRQLSSLLVHWTNFYKIANDRNRAPDHPEEIEKYLELKKKGAREDKGGKDAKDMYKPEKVPDAKLPQGKKGQVNVKNLIFQAFKGLNLDKDVMKDLEQSLNKKLQGIAKQYIAKGMDVNVLEEKLTRYANSVAKQLNEGR